MSKKLKIQIECTNCSAFNVPLLACGRCRLVQYCSRNCQKQHWTIGMHSKLCVPFVDRKPEIPDKFKEQVGAENVVCVICLSAVDTEVCVLPCGHKFHVSCINGIHAHGVSLKCPLCRSDLPNTEKAHADCYRRYYTKIVAESKGEIFNDTSLLEDWTVVAAQGQPEAQFMVGMFHINSNLDIAESWFSKAETHPSSLVNLGFIKSSRGNIDGAIQSYEKAIKLQPDHAKAHFNLGICWLKLKKFSDSIECFRTVIKFEPTNADAFYNLAIAMLGNSFVMGAMAYLKRAIQINPEHDKAVTALAHLED